MAGIHTEKSFEVAIEDSLTTQGGHEKGIAEFYDPTLGVETSEIFAFIGATQINAWNRLVALLGDDQSLAQRQFAERVAKQIDARGTVDVLRHGVEHLNVTIRLAFFRPASGLNPDLESILLMAERRQALITAAVTGELDISKKVA